MKNIENHVRSVFDRTQKPSKIINLITFRGSEDYPISSGHIFWGKRKNAEKVIKNENSEKVIQKWSEKWSKSEPESSPKSGPKSDPKVIPNRSHSGTGYILHVVVSNWLTLWRRREHICSQDRYPLSAFFVLRYSNVSLCFSMSTAHENNSRAQELFLTPSELGDRSLRTSLAGAKSDQIPWAAGLRGGRGGQDRSDHDNYEK